MSCLWVVSPVQAQYVTGVPYFHQYFNSVSPSGSCQNTTIAIALGFYGADLHPDDLSRQYGTEKAQTVSGWEQIFNAQALRLGLAVRDSSLDNASLSDVHRRLDRGLPVPVHGAFTASGHLIVLLGYDEDWYYVHDPAGDWSRNYQLDTPTAGRYARYPRDAVVRAIESPLNSFIRMHALYFDTGVVSAEWLEAPADSLIAGQPSAVQARVRVRSTGKPSTVTPTTVTADLRSLGGDVQPLRAIDDSTWLLASELMTAAAGRHQISVDVTVGAERTQLRRFVDVMAADNQTVFGDGLAASWSEGFVHNVTVTEQADMVASGGRALQFDAQSFIYELQPTTAVDWAGYGVLRFAFHPGTADGGRLPAFSVMANDDPRALVKLLDAAAAPGAPMVDLAQAQWQIVDVPLRQFSWLEAPLTSLRFFGSLRGTFYLDDIELIADRPFPFHFDWATTTPDTVRLGDHLEIGLGVRLRPARGTESQIRAADVRTDLSDLGGPSHAPLQLDTESMHRALNSFAVQRTNNGLADIWVEVAYSDGVRHWQARFNRPVVVLPRQDLLLYEDDVQAPWRQIQATSVRIEVVTGELVHSGSRAMAWHADNLIVEYETDHPLQPVGYDALRLHVRPVDAAAGRIGAFSVMFNGDSRKVVRLLYMPGGLHLDRQVWQRIDIPLTSVRLEEPIRTVRIFGDLSGTLHVDDIRFVAGNLPEPATAVTQIDDTAPAVFSLGAGYPNPFNGSTAIPFHLPVAAQVDLTIFNLLGQPVATPVSSWHAAGVYQANWEASDPSGLPLASGVYLYRLQATSPQTRYSDIGKLLLLR